MAISQKIYNSLPYPVQSFVFDQYCSKLHQKRVGDRFDIELEKMLEMDRFSNSEWRNLQDEKLAQLIEYSYENVPYYRSLMKSLRLKPGDIRTVGDLPKLPVLTKEDVKNNSDKLISVQYRKKDLISLGTSGTTGSPLKIYSDKEAWFVNNLFDWKQKKWAGVNVGDPGVFFLGREVVNPGRNKPPFWQINKYDNVLWVSSFHLSSRYIEYILDKINQFKPIYFEGYPSTLFGFSSLVGDGGLQHAAPYSFTSSEPLYDYMLESIKENLHTENFDFYGLAERVAWATECKSHSGKHLHMDYSVVELVDEEDNLIEADGQEGYLVGTGLFNYAMPLIRYKTSDVTRISSGNCTCGVETPRLSGVSTKSEDMIRTPDGRIISPSVLTHPFKNLTSIRKSQIVQLQVDRIKVKVVSDSPLNRKEENELVNGLQNRMGGEVLVEIEYVDDIPRGNNGKYRWVISRL